MWNPKLRPFDFIQLGLNILFIIWMTTLANRISDHDTKLEKSRISIDIPFVETE